LLEDRVWYLFYKMGFTHLSGEGGARLLLNRDDQGRAANQVDVVALDDEVAIAVECKTVGKPRKAPDFQSHVAKHAAIRRRLADAIATGFPLLDHRRVPVLAIVTWDLILTENDRARAAEQQVVLLDEHDLEYYELLTSHLGQAARYQVLAQMLPGRPIRGLELKVPALQTRMGGYTCYTFPLRADYLLKIAYVSHRARGAADSVDTYQRMVSKSRLKRIRRYITEDGVFPTNIVINLEGKRRARFDASTPPSDPEAARPGTLYLTPGYGSAWVIDGQHRLFGYSGHDRGSTSYLNVLAFDGLPANLQKKWFVDINHEQKSVSRSLLTELYADLNWGEPDEEKRIEAIVSRAVQVLDRAKDSPLYQRVLLADDTRSATRCISLVSLADAINQRGMFTVKAGIEYGPLWAGEPDKTLGRVVHVTSEWFNCILRGGAEGWWELGSAEGGGLAMSDGVTVCLWVLRSVLQHLAASRYPLLQMSDGELVEALRPYGEALGGYLGALSSEDRRYFRAGIRATQGRTAGRRQCEKALHDRFPDFSPPGLAEELELQAAQTSDRASSLVRRIEPALHDLVLNTLKAEYPEGDEWWYQGVPPAVRERIATQREQDQGKKGEREHYFVILDYRKIAQRNWPLFEDTLAYGGSRAKEKGTEWIERLNDIRNVADHYKGRAVTWPELAELEAYENWLQGRPDDTEG